MDFPGPAYRIETKRLVIRCWNPADAPLLKTAIDESLDHLIPWMPWAFYEPQELQKKVDLLRRWRGDFDLGRDFVYGIFNRDESQVLGSTGLHIRNHQSSREIGYWIHRNAIGQGLATETAAALTKVAFEIEKVDYVEIRCDKENVRSAAVPQKLGYTLDGILRRRLPSQNNWADCMDWSIFPDEYPNSPCAKAEIKAYDAAGRQIL